MRITIDACGHSVVLCMDITGSGWVYSTRIAAVKKYNVDWLRLVQALQNDRGFEYRGGQRLCFVVS